MLGKPTGILSATYFGLSQEVEEDTGDPSFIRVCPWHPAGALLIAVNATRYRECHEYCPLCALWIDRAYCDFQA
jgi:hypothetical protein